MSGTVGNNAGRGSGVIATAAGDITKSTSEPATDTNPSGGVGTVWLRTTTGDMYVCTDATTDENVWTNVGGLSGNVSPSYAVDFLVVAGGGGASGGDAAGGAGAGGFRTSYGSGNISGALSAVESDLSFSPGVTYTVTVGAGGVGAAYNVIGNQGVNSSIIGTGVNIVSLGGALSTYNTTAVSGGSGGGDGREGGARDRTAGAGTANQGMAGGVSSPSYGGAGGGGAGAVGANTVSNTGGAGGAGLQSSITGSAVWYAGGGGGATYGESGGAGGSGIGGAGGGNGGDGTVNTGSGGGGGEGSGNTGGDGGSGVVVLRFPTSNYTSTTSGSPTETTDGSDTILKFTSSGSYTA